MDIKKLQNKTSKIEGAMTDDELKALKELDVKEAFATDGTKKILSSVDSLSDTNVSQVMQQMNSGNFRQKFVNNINPQSYVKLAKAIGADGRKIWSALKDTTTPYSQIVQEYGYDNVLQVVKTVYGLGLAENSI